MRRRPPHLIELGTEDYQYLEALVRDGRTEQRVARRARILLAMTAPDTIVQDLAARLGHARNTIWHMCRRYESVGVEAVFDAPRSGRPWEISPPAAGGNRTTGLL
jgi:transposase